MQANAPTKVRFGPFEVDLRTGELSQNGTRVRLQPQPLSVLTILLEHAGELVTREEFRKRLWPTEFVDFEHSLNTDIKKLRHYLGDDADTPLYIETLPKRGYRFKAEALKSTSEARGSPETPSQPPVIIPFPDRRRNAEREPAAAPPIDERTYSKLDALGWLAALIVLGLVGLILNVRWANTDLRIVESYRLTDTSYQKSRGTPWVCALATDGARLYFQQHREADRWVLSQVAAAGGETADIPFDLSGLQCLMGIAPDDSALLHARTDEKGWNFYSVPLPTGTARLLPIPPGANWATWTPDGRLVYSQDNDKSMYISNADGTGRKKLFEVTDINYPRVSPDGKRIRFTVGYGMRDFRREIWEAGIDGSNLHRVLENASFGDWTKDGRIFFFHRRKGATRSLWAVREPGPWSVKNEPVLLYSGPMELQSTVSARIDKRLFAIGIVQKGELSIYDEQSRTFSPMLSGIPACFVEFSRDGQWITYVKYPEGTLWRSRVDGSAKLQLTYPPIGAILPRWSPDGEEIVFMDLYGGDNQIVYKISKDGGAPIPLLNGPEQAGDPTWSPDGKSIAYGEVAGRKGIKILNLETMTSTPVPGSEGLWSPRWSPDGRYIVAHNEDSTRMMLYTVATKTWRQLSMPAAMGMEAWSHDSRYVYAYISAGPLKNAIYRLDLRTDKVELAASLDNVRWTAFRFRMGGWFGLTPDDQVMILRDTGTEEIYAFDLQY